VNINFSSSKFGIIEKADKKMIPYIKDKLDVLDIKVFG
jgi:hypothetical protein